MPEPTPIPLLDRPLDGPLAYRRGRTVGAAEFLGHVHALVHRLPDAGHIINLVRDRYLFTVGFAAVLAAGRCNLLPPNPKPAVQARLADDFDGCAVLHDGLPSAPGLPSLAIPEPTSETTPETAVPACPAESTAAISFTSGSTGEVKPVPKSLHMFRKAAEIYQDRLIPRGSHVVATVPAQHMYGLELTSLQALWSPVACSAGNPSFSCDVAEDLEAVAEPRVLVTTPIHLRAFLESGAALPALERILCATAPLDDALAQRAEKRLGAQILDVYGCTEAGCIATRRAVKEESWTPLPGFVLTPEHGEGGGTTVATAPHLDEPVPLGDRIEVLDDGRFHLSGRLGDTVNIAGKRVALGEIARLLLAVPGVNDGAVFMPPANAGVQRPAALYTGAATRREIRKRMALTLDDVFIPRPLIRVDRLPRNEASKLSRDELLRLYRRYRRAS